MAEAVVLYPESLLPDTQHWRVIILKFNVHEYYVIAGMKNLTDETVRKYTGLSRKAFVQIIESQSVGYQTAELIADAVGCHVGELLLPDPAMCNENAIEWCNDQSRAVVTFSQNHNVERIRRLAAGYPEECRIIVEGNRFISACIPAEWVNIGPCMCRRAASVKRVQAGTVITDHVATA